MSREGAGSRDGCDGSWLTAELGTAPTAPGTGDAALPHGANEPFLPFQHQSKLSTLVLTGPAGAGTGTARGKESRAVQGRCRLQTGGSRSSAGGQHHR